MPKITTKPSEKAVFLIATAGVTFAILALLFVPPVEADSSSGGSSGNAGSQPSSQPTSQPSSRPTTQISTSVQSSPASGTSTARDLNLIMQKDGEKFNAADFPFTKYSEVLESYLQDGMVDYEGLSTTGKTDLMILVTTINETSQESLETLSEDAYKAWYINAYNILTLDTIVRHYPVGSIMDINEPWDTPLNVAGQQLTLNNIEHQILRKIDEPKSEQIKFLDPSLHFAVNCAAIGCPVLQEEPFTADNLEEMYEKGARVFLNNPQRVRLENGTLYLSQLMDWYGDDFVLIYGDQAQDLINKLKSNGTANPEKVGAVAYFFSTIADENLSEKLLAGNYDMQWIEYDWSLNEQ